MTIRVLLNAGSTLVATGFDRFPILLPFDTDFPYTQGNLHIWIYLTPLFAPYDVDAAGDTGDPRYGLHYPTTRVQGGSVERVGWCPILGLLPSTATAGLVPELRAFGEPWLGRSLELQVIGAPAQASVFLVSGGWSPGTGTPCAQHVNPITSSVMRTADPFGFARWDPWTVPNDPAFLHAEVAFQVLVAPTSRASNAFHVTIGGGL